MSSFLNAYTHCLIFFHLICFSFIVLPQPVPSCDSPSGTVQTITVQIVAFKCKRFTEYNWWTEKHITSRFSVLVLHELKRHPQDTCAPSKHEVIKAFVKSRIERQELNLYIIACRAAFISEVFDLMSTSARGLQRTPEWWHRKKISIKHEKIFICEMKMHSYSLKCQSDQQRLEVHMYVFDLQNFFFPFYFFLFVLECAHILCKTLLLYFSLSLMLHYLPLFLSRSGILYYVGT